MTTTTTNSNAAIDATTNGPLDAMTGPHSALARCGWERQADGRSWICPTDHGPAELIIRTADADWLRWELRGGKLPTTSTARVLTDNAVLCGPAKFVARAQGKPICLVDVPNELIETATETYPSSASFAEMGFESLGSHLPWARAVTECVTGQTHSASVTANSKQAVVEQLKSTGWSASLDDDEIRVHVQRPALFREIAFESQADDGVRATCDLIELTGLSSESRRAVKRLALQANARLPLVRLAIDERRNPLVMRAEVHFGRALIPGAWLSTAIESLETAIVLTAQEFEALKGDPELAKLVLTIPPV